MGSAVCRNVSCSGLSNYSKIVEEAGPLLIHFQPSHATCTPSNTSDASDDDVIAGAASSLLTSWRATTQSKGCSFLTEQHCCLSETTSRQCPFLYCLVFGYAFIYGVSFWAYCSFQKWEHVPCCTTAPLFYMCFCVCVCVCLCVRLTI